MKSIIPFLLFLFLVIGCGSPASEQVSRGERVNAADFPGKVAQTGGTVVDVRTLEEFEAGHLPGAVHIDWYADDFLQQMEQFSTSEPIFLYCHSGNRSQQAMTSLISAGYKKVYDLEGGFRGIDLASGERRDTGEMGMAADEYLEYLNTDKTVLVDFYAEWCGPCKKMEPFLKEMQEEMANELIIVRIDADSNATVANLMQVHAIPTLLVYKNQEVRWRHVGFADKETLTEQIVAARE